MLWMRCTLATTPSKTCVNKILVRQADPVAPLAAVELHVCATVTASDAVEVLNICWRNRRFAEWLRQSLILLYAITP